MSNIYKNPMVWNDSIWMFLYCCGFTYPETPSKKDQKFFKLLLETIHYVLPCELCRVYFLEFIKKNNISPILSKKKKVLLYIIRLRNYVMKFYEPKNQVTLKSVKKNILKKCHENKESITIKNPKIWGNSTWFFLHCSSFNYPKRPKKIEKQKYHLFLVILQHTLPCKICRKQLKEYMTEYPIDEHLQSRRKYIHYIIRLHNHVNEKYTKKPKIEYKFAKQMILDNCFYQYEKNTIHCS